METLTRPSQSPQDHFQRERWQSQWTGGQPEQQQRAVVAGRAIEVDLVTAGAPVDEDPLPRAADAHGDGLHRRAARRSPVAGRVVVDMPAPQAGRAMVAVGGAGRVEWDVELAVSAAEAVSAPVSGAVALIARQGETSMMRGARACRRY